MRALYTTTERLSMQKCKMISKSATSRFLIATAELTKKSSMGLMGSENGPHMQFHRLFQAAAALQVLRENSNHVRRRFRNILHGMPGRHDSLGPPGKVAGPIGNHAV